METKATPCRTNSCLGCGGPVSKQSRTGRCRVCALAAMNADPVTRERKARANRRKAQDPVFRAKLKARIAQAGRDARSDAEFLEIIRECGRRNIAAAFTPEARAKWHAGRKEAGKKRTATCMAWCPADRIAEYRNLTRIKKIPAAEAKRMILATPTPFQAMLNRVRDGAGIITVKPIRRPEPTFTLGGVSEL